MALINVIIPVYNAKKYLRDAVRSVLDQPCKDIEIILVNDGSTDGSAELCDKLAAEESRISVVHQQNQGVSAARNAGIERVLEGGTDGYIAFLDADDAWYPDVFTEQMRRLIASSQMDLFVFDAVHSDPSMTKFSAPYGKTLDEVRLGSQSVWRGNSTYGTLLCPTSLIKKFNIRFKVGLRYHEDEMYRIQCVFLSEKVHFCKACLYIYRRHPGGAIGKITSIPSIERYMPMVAGWIWSDDFINNHSEVTGREIYTGHVLAGIYLLEMAIFHFQQGRPKKEIMSVLYSHPHFALLRDMRPQDVSAKQYRDSRLLLEKPMVFQMKYLLIGIVVRGAKQLRKIPAIAKWEENRRYPYSELPKK